MKVKLACLTVQVDTNNAEKHNRRGIVTVTPEKISHQGRDSITSAMDTSHGRPKVKLTKNN